MAAKLVLEETASGPLRWNLKPVTAKIQTGRSSSVSTDLPIRQQEWSFGGRCATVVR